MPQQKDADEPFFRALLTPHRSLGRKGFVTLMLVLLLAWASTGIVFLSMGAWPVFGFFGLDVALLYWAFRRNYRDAEISEQVEITDSSLVVRKQFPRQPPREWRLIPYWVRVELVEDEELETCGPLWLVSHGKRLEIGSFLSPDERRDLAGALRRALQAGRASR